MKRHSILAIIGIGLCLAMPKTALAGGSFFTKDVMPILQQNTDLYQCVKKSFDLDSGGWATRIGSRVNEDLGGARIGPYTIQAKPKGSKGGWLFYLVIEVETKYYDVSGKEVSLYQGKTMKEKLTGISIEPIPKPESK